MNFDPFFANILTCPLCRSLLETRDTMLVCQACAKSFPLRDEVPFLIPEAAQPFDDFFLEKS